MFFTGGSNDIQSVNPKKFEAPGAWRGENVPDPGGEGEDEEDGTLFGLSDQCDVTENGIHIALSFDAESNSFEGVA